MLRLPDGREMARPEFEERLATLRAPFPTDQVEKLPKVMRRDDNDRGACKEGSRYSADGHHCGGYHARAMHLDYVGHAGITMRLGEADPFWTWEPMSLRPDGTPHTSDGGLWIRLTVLGITRLGFGDAAGKSGPNAVKEMIGDGLRNGALRHGVATYLWSKSEAAEALKRAEEPEAIPAPRSQSSGQDVTHAPGAGAQRVASAIAVMTPWQVDQVRANWPRGYGAPESLTDAQADEVGPLLLHWAGQEEPLPNPPA